MSYVETIVKQCFDSRGNLLVKYDNNFLGDIGHKLYLCDRLFLFVRTRSSSTLCGIHKVEEDKDDENTYPIKFYFPQELHSKLLKDIQKLYFSFSKRIKEYIKQEDIICKKNRENYDYFHNQ